MTEFDPIDVDPDEILEGEEIPEEVAFGEQDDAALEEEWAEDAAEGGATEL